MNKVSFVVLASSVMFLVGCDLFLSKDRDPYPVSLEQLQHYHHFHDFADRPVLTAGALTHENSAFFLSDDIDGHHWVVEIATEDADMRRCMLQMVGKNFVIATGDFLANARLGNIKHVTDGEIGCPESWTPPETPGSGARQ